MCAYACVYPILKHENSEIRHAILSGKFTFRFISACHLYFSFPIACLFTFRFISACHLYFSFPISCLFTFRFISACHLYFSFPISCLFTFRFISACHLYFSFPISCLLTYFSCFYIIFQILFQFQFIYFSVGSPAILILGGRGGGVNIFKYILWIYVVFKLLGCNGK